MGEKPLMSGKIIPACDDQPFGIDKPAVFTGILFGKALLNHRRNDQIADAEAGLSRAVKQQLLFSELPACDPQGRVETGQGGLSRIFDGVQQCRDADGRRESLF
jgi:hypothetical protein